MRNSIILIIAFIFIGSLKLAGQMKLLTLLPTDGSAVRLEMTHKHALAYTNPIFDGRVKAGLLASQKFGQFSLKAGGTYLVTPKDQYGPEAMVDWVSKNKQLYLRANVDYLIPAKLTNLRLVTSFAPVKSAKEFRVVTITTWNKMQGWKFTPALAYIIKI